MEIIKKNLVRCLFIIIAFMGLFYAFFNVIQSRFKGNERQKQIEEVIDPIISNLEDARRLECQSYVYIRAEDGDRQDPAQSMQLIHDFSNKRLQFAKGNIQEILEYGDKTMAYSKGISPVYEKEKMELKKVALDRWYRYSCEEMYGTERIEGKNERISYGYLIDVESVKEVKKTGTELLYGVECDKYIAVIENTLRSEIVEPEEDNHFRKKLGAYGLDPMRLQKNYPEAYKRMKGIYDDDSEELVFWVDGNGKLVRIEKDYTFLYYIDVLKGNSDRIREQMGMYGYPEVICQQNYRYSPDCNNIYMPKDVIEL